MKQIIKRGSFFTLMFMLLGCLSLYAADNGLITKQITINPTFTFYSRFSC